MEYEIGPEESASVAVVRAVSATVGREPTSLRPLAEVLDPDALDALLESLSTGPSGTDGRLSFVYGNCRVTVRDETSLTVRPLDPDATASVRDGDPDPATRAPAEGGGDSSPGRAPPPHICFVCQQPIGGEDPRQERGELVHERCRAELRCGVSLD